MIEQGIYFALGCIVTALLAIGFAPILWARALRLTRRRLQLQIPVSMQEILADRDLLRAQFAVERVQIEQALERVQATKASDMAENGRRTVEAATLAQQLAVSRALARDQAREIETLARDLAEAGAEIGALKIAMHGEDGQIIALKQKLAGSKNEVQSLLDEAQDHRAAKASLETRNMGLEMRLTDAERAHAANEKRNEAAMRSRLEAAVSQANRHEASALSAQRERDEAKAQVRALDQELDAAREREKASHLQRSLQSEKARGADRARAEQLDLLQAEKAALQQALETARSEAAPAANDGADGGLRASIHALGLAVAVMSRDERKTEPAPRRTLGPAADADLPIWD